MGSDREMQESDYNSGHDSVEGKHLYQFYKGKEDLLRIMLPFFQTGLEKSEGCLWLVSERIGVEEVKAIAEKEIPGFLSYISSGQFQILSAEEWYLTDGGFDETKALSNAVRFGRHMNAKGFKRLRIAGDAGAVPHEDWVYSRSYEEKVDALVKAGPHIALCAYPILDCDLKDTKMVLDCHDDVLIGRF
jgi:hypothetical protein